MELTAALNEITALRTENQGLRANLEAVQFQLAQLQRMIFGHRREQLNIDAHTGLLFEVAPPPAPEPIKREVAVTPKKKPVREKLPAHLPREVTVVDLPEEQKPCPCCGGERHVIGEIVSEKLDYVPATLKVLETRRPKYACRPCKGEVAVAPLPPSPIEQGMAAPGLLAHVLVSKFADHLPLNRQEAILRRHGIELPRSTLCDWVMACADLLVPLYDHLVAHVLTGDILHSDDTIIPLQQKGATVKARAWSYLNPLSNLVAYEFTESRAGKHPQAFLAKWQGYLVADAYSGYDRLFDNPALLEVGCMAHYLESRFILGRWGATLVAIVRSAEQTPHIICRRIEAKRRMGGWWCRSRCGHSRVPRLTLQAASGAMPVCLHVPCIRPAVVHSPAMEATRA